MGFLLFQGKTIKISNGLLSDGKFALLKDFNNDFIMGRQGNTFDNSHVKYGHAKRVWRTMRHVYPCGGTIKNVNDFVGKGVIPAGSPVKFNTKTKEIEVMKDDAIKNAENVNTLGINGYLQEDVLVKDAQTIGTGTVVYAGEIYEYMFDDDVVAKLKTLQSVPQIVWVY